MSALSVDKVFQFIQFVSNKEHRGYVTPEEFNIVAEVAQLSLYSELEAVYNATKKIEADLRPFLKTVTIASGSTAIPADFRIPISCYDDTVEVVEIDVSELPGRLGSSIVAPSASYPIFYIDDAIEVLPAGLSGITLYYLSEPVAPEWGYTTTSGRPVYAAGSSTQFGFDETLFLEISKRILEQVGINIGKEEITQYALQKSA